MGLNPVTIWDWGPHLSGDVTLESPGLTIPYGVSVSRTETPVVFRLNRCLSFRLGIKGHNVILVF